METVLKAKGLCKNRNRFSLKDIDIRVKKGEIFLITGSNGAGKTTLLEALACISPPWKGQITILGNRVFDDGLLSKQIKKVNGRLAILSQNQGIFESLTVNETIELFSSLYDQKLNMKIIDDCPYIQNELDKRIKNLSEGKKKLTDFLLSTINSPDILFLDEPESNLDDETRTWINDKIGDMKDNGKSIILTSSEIWKIGKIVDKMIYLENGRIVNRLKGFDRYFDANVLEIDKKYYKSDMIPGVINIKESENKVLVFSSESKKMLIEKCKEMDIEIKEIRGIRLNDFREGG